MAKAVNRIRPVTFLHTLEKHQQSLVRQQSPSTLQINLGKLCNLACQHCHVDAGPKRTEIMQWETISRILTLLKNSPSIQCIDLTGGAPELNPYFTRFIEALRSSDFPRYQIIDRCNLSVLFEPGQESTAEFLAKHHVDVVASLPCYSEKNVDTQRGKGSFNKSIRALKQLNQLGYGLPHNNNGLILNLVYNPIGDQLPPPQSQLEKEYKQKLQQDFGIHFNQLFTITNIAIKRFAQQLRHENVLDSYQQKLRDNFNPIAAEQLMCRELISISWDGQLFDCDFNQMLDMPAANQSRTLFDIDNFEQLTQQNIASGEHCYACTAGSGSSCSGSLTQASNSNINLVKKIT